MFKKNVNLKHISVSPWRKLAMGTWRNAKDPSVYGSMDIEAQGIMDCIESYKAKGIRLTPTAVVAKAIAVAMKEVPSINCIIRFGRFYQREKIDIFLQVAADQDGEDLSGMVIRDCDNKPLESIATEIKAKAQKIRDKEEKEYSEGKKNMKLLPGIFLPFLIDFLGFVLYSLNIWTPLLGAPRDGFGSAMVTSVGMLGLDGGFPPLVPYSRCPILVALGRIQQKPVVNDDGEIVAKLMVPFSVTFDHRLLDGVGAAKLMKALLKYLKDPY
ncbi:MAG: hypothetical protein HOE90_01560 [Bacteriovoracaceae bacterium]|jgi:pyruvate/2-oxoglutarate dehydrogenase complex dihydrolipoamide acyltransferase (E2) component|nr:hypothetical protein [Bacteriovoracaceae bacterium]